METNPYDLRNAIVAFLVGIALLTFVIVLENDSQAAHPIRSKTTSPVTIIPDIYQCEDIRGCTALVTPPDGKQRPVMFRKGDIISTGAGMLPDHSERIDKRTGERQVWWGWRRLRDDDQAIKDRTNKYD